jgi:hypothetical protein
MKRKLGGREYVFSVPPSVPESLWQKVNAMLNGNKKMSRRNGKHEYLLSGLLKCLTCHQNGHEHTMHGTRMLGCALLKLAANALRFFCSSPI